MTREEAKSVIKESLITSLGKLPHGYVVYAITAETIIDKIFDEMPKPIYEVEAKFKIQEGLSRLVLSSDDIALSCDIPSNMKNCIIKIYEDEK
jgi:hypothetical protein